MQQVRRHSGLFIRPAGGILLADLMQKNFTFRLVLIAVGLTLLLRPAAAQQHRATHLGNPATRFAPPLTAPADLRARFADPKLRPDITAILRQWGWTGNLDDFFGAAATNAITDIRIPVGTRMPFMSSREDGQPVTLRDVLWAGREPIPAYTFEFYSRGRHYRCVTPKPCSNFFLEDLGAPALAVECSTPDSVPIGRPVPVALTVRNTGNDDEPSTRLTLPIPAGATVLRASDAGIVSASEITWNLASLAPKTNRQVQAVFSASEAGVLAFDTTASGQFAAAAKTACSTRIVGIPAILLQTRDLEDPVEVGMTVTYEVKVTNQGTAPGTNIRLACTLPASEDFVSGQGPTAVWAKGQTLTTDPLPALAPKGVATWTFVVRALHAEDAHFVVKLSSDQFAQPIEEEESTHLY